MAGRSSRLRRYKSKYDERRLKEKTQLKNEVALQRSYISDYEKFSKIADTTSTWASSGTYRNPREIAGLNISVFNPQAPRSRRTVNNVIGKDDYGKDIYQFNSFLSFKYFTPEQRISFAGGSTSKPKADRIDKYSSYSSNKRALPSTFQKIADRLKPLAIGAEMGALSKAEKAWASWEDIAFDSSSVGSSRGMGGSVLGSSSTVKVDSVTGQFISGSQAKSNDGGKTWTFKEPGDTGYNASASKITGVNNFSNQKFIDMGKLATDLEGKSQEQKAELRNAYLSKFGLTSDSKYGTDAKKSGPESVFSSSDQMDAFTRGNQIDYEGFKDLSTKEQNEFRGLLADKLVGQDAAYKRLQLGISERETNKELDKLKKELEKKEQKAIDDEKKKIIAQQNIKLTPKQQEAKFASGIWDATSVINISFGMPEAFASELTPTQKEIVNLKEQIDKKQTKIQLINTQSANTQNMIDTAGAHTVFNKAYDAGRISDESRAQLLTSTHKNDSDMNFIFQRKLKYDSDETKEELSDISKALSQIEYLKKNRNRTGSFELSMAKINSLVPSVLIDGEPGSSPEVSSIQGVKKQLEKMSTAKLKKLKGLEGARDQLGSNIISASHKDRDTFIGRVNDPMNAKRELEKLTGMDIVTGSMTTSMSPQDATKLFRVGGLAPGSDTQKTFDSHMRVDKSNQKPDGSGRHYAPESSWYDAWQSGNIDRSEVHKSEYDIIMRGDPKVYKTQAELQSKKNIMDKYDTWSTAKNYIGSSIAAWKTEMLDYYRSSYKDEPHPESYYIPQLNEGSSTIIPLDARSSQEEILFGERGGIRRDGDMGEIQDLAKLMTALQKEDKVYEQNYIKYGEKVKAQKEKVKILQKRHDSYGPEVDAKVSEANRLEKEKNYMEVDLKLSKKLEKSSQDLFDEKNKLTKLQIQHKRYGLTKDVIKKDISEIKQERRDTQKEILRANMHTSTRRATPGRGRLWGYAKSKQFSRRTTAKIKRTKGGNMSLGGLVL